MVLAYPVCASSGLIIQHKKALDCVHAGLWVQSVSILGLTFLSEWWVIHKLVPKTLNYSEGVLAMYYLSRFVLFVSFFLWNYLYFVLIEISLCLLYHWSKDIFVPINFQNLGRGFWDVIALDLDPFAHPPTATSLLIFWLLNNVASCDI